MNRFLACIATGLCAAPLLALAGFAITSALLPSGGGGSDQTIGRGYAGLAGGIALAAVGFFVAALWGRFKPRHPGNASASVGEPA